MVIPPPEHVRTGDFLAGYRTALGVRQFEVAAELGWNRARVHELERALTPTASVVQRYLEALGRLQRREASR